MPREPKWAATLNSLDGNSRKVKIFKAKILAWLKLLNYLLEHKSHDYGWQRLLFGPQLRNIFDTLQSIASSNTV